MRVGVPLFVLLAVLVGVPASADEEASRLYDPDFRPGAPTDVLVKGEVALTRGDVHAFIDLFETAFDLALTATQEQTLRDRIEEDFTAADAAGRRAWLALATPLDALKAKALEGDRDAVKQGLREFRKALDERLRADADDPVFALLADVLKRRYEVTWPGTPAIDRAHADVYLELVVFVTSVGRGTRIAPTGGQLDALRKDLTEYLHGQPRSVREQLQAVHRTWLATKAAWDRGGEPRRFPFRWRALRFLAKVLPPDVEHEVVSGDTLADFAKQAAMVAALQPKPFDALANVARNPELLLRTVHAGLQIDPSSKEFPFVFR